MDKKGFLGFGGKKKKEAIVGFELKPIIVRLQADFKEYHTKIIADFEAYCQKLTSPGISSWKPGHGTETCSSFLEHQSDLKSLLYRKLDAEMESKIEQKYRPIQLEKDFRYEIAESIPVLKLWAQYSRETSQRVYEEHGGGGDIQLRADLDMRSTGSKRTTATRLEKGKTKYANIFICVIPAFEVKSPHSPVYLIAGSLNHETPMVGNVIKVSLKYGGSNIDALFQELRQMI